ncbi:MAG: trigger factor [Gemmatimonadaceae bacterium]|nr:trigger factor [Gemmatimonadaceae bacterium]
MEIQITSTKSEGAERRIQVAVSGETVKDAKKRAARRVAQQVRLPGFRIGKAPAAMVEKKYADVIQQEALEQVMRDAYQQVIDQEKLKLVTQPHAHDVKFAEDEALSFELHCEVQPDIALAHLSGFQVKRPAATVSNEQVKDQIEQLRDARATWTPVEEKPVEGDMVVVMLAMADESGALPDGKEYRVVLGAGQAIPAIEELLMELTPGGTVERPVRWPDDFPDETQRGKTKTVRAELKEVKRKEVPALDDAWAREMGDFDSLDALTAAVRTDLEANAVRDADAAVRGLLLDEIIGANAFDVPPSWVSNLVQSYAQAYGIPETEQEKFAAEFRATAERQVRRELVIETIAERERLAATEADVDAKIQEMAEKRGANPGQVYAQLQKANRLREIERGITEDRVFAWLLERNTVEQQ